MGKTIRNTRTKERNIGKKFDRWYLGNKGIYSPDEVEDMVEKRNPKFS